jgi:hypothetical protein
MGNLKTLVGCCLPPNRGSEQRAVYYIIAITSDGAWGSTMKTSSCWRYGCALGLGLALTILTGCQTWTSGMTLPSPRYLEHPPQYFPESPPYPLTRELASMEAAAAGQAPGAAAVPPAPAPAPVPGAR